MKITVLGRMNKKMRKLHDFMLNKVECVSHTVCSFVIGNFVRFNIGLITEISLVFHVQKKLARTYLVAMGGNSFKKSDFLFFASSSSSCKLKSK